MRVTACHRDAPGHNGEPAARCESVDLVAECGEDLEVLTAFVARLRATPGTTRAALAALLTDRKDQAGG